MRFTELKDQWLLEIKYSSNSNQIVTNENYLEIIAMGEKAIPHIVMDWKTTNNHWFVALRGILLVNPVDPANAGDIRAMKADWLKYLRNHWY